MFKLRGHHLFCLPGYRGMGYSQDYVENMTALHQILRNHPETWVQVVNGPDHLCEKYPNSGEYHCENENIYARDAAILGKMEIKVGDILKWEDIEGRIQKYISPDDILHVCETCSWRSYGVCQEGIQEILDGKGLREVK